MASIALPSRDMRVRARYVPVILLVCLFCAVVLRTAWLSDDAFITFRTIDNLVGGYGLTWNTGERVQAFTHPLWLLLLAPFYAVTGDMYLTAILVSVVASVATVVLYAARLASSALPAMIGVAVLLFSKAFTDYSTSGLENPLTHLLLAVFLYDYLERGARPGSLLKLSLLAGLMTLNRMDTLLLILPALAFVFWQERSWRAAGSVLVGFLPFIAWELFALVYYGYALPNTAYAKLNTGIGAMDSFRQGLSYCLVTLNIDPLTLIAIAAGVIAAIVVREPRQVCLAIGIVLYLLYVVRIGADFMAGRFFSAGLLAAVVLLTRLPGLTFRSSILVLLLIVLIGLASPRNPLLSGDGYGARLKYIDDTGVGDERAFYYEATGLLRYARDKRLPDHAWVDDGRAARERAAKRGPIVVVAENIGFFGFHAGPRVHVVDPMALSDPLLARLPIDRSLPWRIGHFKRAIPAGYVETLETGRNVIADREVAAAYERIALITRGPVLGRERLHAIVRGLIGG
jgi:arabinofuranosyltransferase